MNHIISAKDMCLWYGEHQALKNVNIDIPEEAKFGKSSIRINTLED